MEKFITVTDNSSVPHTVRVGAISQYTVAGGYGVHAVITFDNGGYLNAAETVSEIDALIVAALAA